MFFIQLTGKILCLALLCSCSLSSQNVYKTPSGTKYHLSSCRMVENVSSKLTEEDKSSGKYHPCKICKPPSIQAIRKGNKHINKSVGQKQSQQCIGKTAKGTRCKHMTRLGNGYCYQHTEQANKSYYKKSSSGLCGARTKSGASCKRRTKNGKRCYQHEKVKRSKKRHTSR